MANPGKLLGKALTNMKEKHEVEKEVAVKPVEVARESYPWGLRITLNGDSVKKLGLKASSFTVNDTISLVAKAKVVSLNSHESEGGEKSETIELQITDMSIPE